MTQDEAFDLLKTGRNVFITGPAGSGKTHLLNAYIAYLEKHKVPVAVTASTGIAATHMNGRTIHSWTGIGIKKELSRKDFFKLQNNPNVADRVRNAKVLIIDEISMLEARLFNLADSVCRVLRNSQKPFGGLQVVLCGDFFQLPPVQKDGEPKAEFAFEARSWDSAEPLVCYLEKQYRQNDLRFLSVLNTIRQNEVTEETSGILMERYQQPVEGFPKPTRLRTHNRDVDAINNFELGNLPTEEHRYRMESRGDPNFIADLKKSCLAPEELVVKEGAVVMFVKNDFGKGYVNGTIGVVTGYDPDTTYPIVQIDVEGETKLVTAEPTSWVIEDEDDTELASIIQVPLRLAWAITVHKSQGMSLDCAEIDLSKAFVEGMGYVALSRVRSLAGMKLMGINDMALKVSQEITDFDVHLQAASIVAEEQLHGLGKIKLKLAQAGFLLR